MIIINKFRIAFLIIIVAMLSSCNDKQGLVSIQYHKPVQLVDSRSIYEVINFCLKNEDIGAGNCKNLVDGGFYNELSDSDTLALLRMDTILTKDDIQFMSRQKRYNSYFKISTKYIKGYKLIPSDKILSMIQKSKDEKYDYHAEMEKLYKGHLYNIGIPLFSKNKKYCLVSTSYSCGIFCGYGASYVLKRTGKTWKIIYTYDEWVS